MNYQMAKGQNCNIRLPKKNQPCDFLRPSYRPCTSQLEMCKPILPPYTFYAIQFFSFSVSASASSKSLDSHLSLILAFSCSVALFLLSRRVYRASNRHQRLQRCYCTTYNCCIMPEVLFSLCAMAKCECLSRATILLESQTNRGIYTKHSENNRRGKKIGNVITPTAEPATTTSTTTMTTTTTIKKKERRCTRRRNIAIEIRNAIGPLKISHNNNIIHSSTVLYTEHTTTPKYT